MYEDIMAFPFFDASLPVNCILMGISYCDGTYYISRQSCPHFVFEYIIKGKGKIIDNGIEYEPVAGDSYVLYPGSNHHYYSSSEDPWQKIWINIDGDIIHSLLKTYKINGAIHFKDANTYDLFEEIYKATRSDMGYDRICHIAAVKIHEIISRLSRSQTQPDTRRPEALAIKSILDASLEKKLTLSDISDKVYLSPSQITRIFKHAYGETPYEYLLSKRIETAKIMLSSTNMQIKDISYKLGFADEHYFSNCFKSRVQLSPREFRKL